MIYIFYISTISTVLTVLLSVLYLLSFICDVQKVDRPGDCRTNGALSCSLDRYWIPTIGILDNIQGMFTKGTKGLCILTVTYLTAC